MKKVMLVALLLICWANVFAQNDSIQFDDEGGFSRVVEVKATAKQAFQYTREFFSNKIKDYQKAVQIEDAEINKIQVNNQFWFEESAKPVRGTSCKYIGFELYKITIDCKDSKIRAKVEKPTYNYDLYAGNMKFDTRKSQPYILVCNFVANKENFLNKRAAYYISFINDLVKYIEKQVSEEDF